MREKVSDPITNAHRKSPLRKKRSAVASANTNPEHTACMSNAAPRVIPRPA
jgi:hypothetical protein